MSKNIAVILSGCGASDGSEIHEAISTLIAIDKLGAKYTCYAPNRNQFHVINHLNGEVMQEKRNILVEAARIARGKVKPLSDFVGQEDALIIPGGYGAAKNLCDYAFKGANCSVNEDIAKAVELMFNKKKPIGALCIAPIILAKVLNNITLTLGENSDASLAAQKMGATHKTTSKHEIVVDIKNKIVTSPCYMVDSSIYDIVIGAENAVKAVLELT